MATESDDEAKRESGNPGGGKGRRDETGKSGVYPMSGPLPKADALIQPMASWGQGIRGAAGYLDAGSSGMEDPVARERLRAENPPARTTPRSCRDVMTEFPAFCVAGDPAPRAAVLMRSEDVGAIPVVADQSSGRLVGIVTDRDLALKIVAERADPDATSVGEVMTPDPVVCRPEDGLEEAVRLMERARVRRIPVVDADGRLIGIITQADIATRLGAPEKTAEVLEEISQPR